MRSLVIAPLANLADPDTTSRFQALQPTHNIPVTPIPDSALPLPPNISWVAALRSCHSLNPSGAAGPDRLSTRLRRHIAVTSVSQQAGVKSLSVLTNLVHRLSRGNLPAPMLPLFTAAVLLPIQPKPDKIRPIAIGQALRWLVTKVLLGPNLTENREYLASEQLSNGMRAGMDSSFHDA